MEVKLVYTQLRRTFGPQGWWPIWEHGVCYGVPYNELGLYRTTSRDPYFEIAVGAILTQNTAWHNAAAAIGNLFQARALAPASLLALSPRKLEQLVRPAGYFRQKTKKLWIFAAWLQQSHNGDILNLRRFSLAVTREQLLALWGIGPETADSILLYALDRPIFVVDTYTRRLCATQGLNWQSYDEYQRFFMDALPRNTKRYREYHALIVAWGKQNRKSMVYFSGT